MERTPGDNTDREESSASGVSYGALGSYRALVSNSLLVASGEISFLKVAENYEKHSKVPPWGTRRIWRRGKPLNERSVVVSIRYKCFES
jgi:hypothetical protein